MTFKWPIGHDICHGFQSLARFAFVPAGMLQCVFMIINLKSIISILIGRGDASSNFTGVSTIG